MIQRLCEDFGGRVEVLEHYDDYYKFKLEKHEGSSIGKLFGLIEECKDTLISEYSVSQTTMEQIF